MPSAGNSSDRFEALTLSLRALAERGVTKTFRKGQRLIDEGDSGDTLYIILRGRLRVFGSSDIGREITYGSYAAGEYIGEMSLDGGPRSANVEATEATECVQVTRQTLLLHIGEHPEFALELIARVIRSARAATVSTKRLALNDAYGRLVLLLNSLAGPQAEGTRLVGERLTHQEIANRLGCSREMVSRLMKDLEGGGYIDGTASHYRLLKVLPTRW